MTPADTSAAASLGPLLITLNDLPTGYSSSPSTITGAYGEFNGAVPATLPLAGVSFNFTGNPDSYDEPVYFGVGVSEVLGETASSQTAITMAARLNAISLRCNRSTSTELPGTPPSTEASTFSGENSDTAYSYVIAYVTKGPYVAQLTWGVVSLRPKETGTTHAPTSPLSLPSPASMAQIVDAAFGHIPS